MLPNILWSRICSCIVLQLVNGWKILTIVNDMLFLMWLYMPCGIFLTSYLLPLVQHNYNVYNRMCPLELNFLSFISRIILMFIHMSIRF
jgi:hypothetical protein